MSPNSDTTRSNRPPTVAERWYRLGADLARTGRFHEALQPLEQALAYSAEQPNAPFISSLRSFYGVTIAIVRGDLSRGRRLCEEAVFQGVLEPELYINLATVYLHSGRKDLAVETLDTGLSLSPGDRILKRLREQLGRRQRPVFPFLNRNHLLNRYAGRLRHRLQTVEPPPVGSRSGSSAGLTE
jgi:tetratricopeptide (TPR) repeat protein